MSSGKGLSVEINCQDNMGPFSPTILRNILCLFLQDFVNLNAIRFLIGKIIWLHSNAAKHRKIWKTRLEERSQLFTTQS